MTWPSPWFIRPAQPTPKTPHSELDARCKEGLARIPVHRRKHDEKNLNHGREGFGKTRAVSWGRAGLNGRRGPYQHFQTAHGLLSKK